MIMDEPGDESALIDFLLLANRLKIMPRTGWVVRGLVNVESVAAHSYATALIALILAGRIDQPVDRQKLLAMALVHDLPEALTTDIPGPAQRFLPAGARASAEWSALVQLLDGLDFAESVKSLWQELKDRQSVEAKLVRDADRLDMLLQAYFYQQTTGNQYLEEFWTNQDNTSFAFAASQRLYQSLCERRQARS